METDQQTERPLPKVTDEEKLEFFKAFLSDKPFIAEDSLLNGAVKVKFKSLTTQENMEIFDLLRKEQIEGVLTNDASYTTQLASYRLSASIYSINDARFGLELQLKDKDDTMLMAKSRLIKGSWPVFKTAAFAEAFRVFEEKIIYLTKEIQTENFWPAAK